MDRESDNETTSRMNRISAGTTAPRVGFPASLQGLGSILHKTSVASGGAGGYSGQKADKITKVNFIMDDWTGFHTGNRKMGHGKIIALVILIKHNMLQHMLGRRGYRAQTIIDIQYSLTSLDFVPV